MKKIFIIAAILSICHFSAKAAMAVPFGDGGAKLQGVLDDITVGGPSSVIVTTDEVPDLGDSLWMIGSNDGSPSALSTLVIEVATFAGQNRFGIYDADNPFNMVELFDGSAVAGNQISLSITAMGDVIVGGTDTDVDFTAGNKFGFFLDSSADTRGGLFFSDTSLNADGTDHMAAFEGRGDMIDILPSGERLWGANQFIFAWEDLTFPGADGDFIDFVVLIDYVYPMPTAIPEPGTIALLGIGLAGLVGAGVRRRMMMKKS